MIQTKSSKRRIRRKKINKIETLTEIMEKIECVGTQKVKELNPNNNDNIDLGSKLCNIMQEGANEFIAKTGRNMTYSEMRSMYG